MKLGHVIGIAFVIMMAALAGDFHAIASPVQKILAYMAVAFAPSVAIYYRKMRFEGMSRQSVVRNVLLSVCFSMGLALPLLYFWRGHV